MFRIQAGIPRAVDCKGVIVDELGEALQDAVAFPSEHIVIVWPTAPVTPVLVCYKYDLSWIIDDVAKMLHALQQMAGEHIASFFSDTFTTRWHMSWQGDALSIRAEWDSALGSLSSLREAPEIALSKAAFLAEWRMPLEQMRTKLHESAIQFRTSEPMIKLDQLIRLLPELGVLYKQIGHEGDSAVME